MIEQLVRSKTHKLRTVFHGEHSLSGHGEVQHQFSGNKVVVEKLRTEIKNQRWLSQSWENKVGHL